jgi:hypothetical protein
LGCLTCRPVSRRMPWPLCRGGTRRHQPGPWGSGGPPGCRRAARGTAACRGRARLATEGGGGGRGPGGFDDGAGAGATSRIVGGQERQSHCPPLLDGGSGTALGPPRAVRLVGDLLAPGRQGIRAGGIGHVGQARGPGVGQRPAAPPQVTGSAPAGGRDRGLREPAATEQGGHLVRIPCVLVGRPAREGLPVTRPPNRAAL